MHLNIYQELSAHDIAVALEDLSNQDMRAFWLEVATHMARLMSPGPLEIARDAFASVCSASAGAEE